MIFVQSGLLNLLVTLGQSKDCYESPSGSFNCPRLFDIGGKPLSPLPRTPIHKRKDQLPGSQSQRADNRTDRQTDRYTNKLRPLNFFIICGSFKISIYICYPIKPWTAEEELKEEHRLVIKVSTLL